MTIEQFSNEFDVLVDSYRRFKDFDKKLELDSIEFNEYEKSVFLTLAQEEIVKELYSGAGYQSFESDEETRRKLASLVKQKVYNVEDGSTHLVDKYRHKSYTLPTDCWYIIYEQVSLREGDDCLNEKVLSVYPVTHDDYYRITHNPFRGPNKRKVLRLDIGNEVELVSSYNIGSYTIRYVSKPTPIVLCNLQADDINIDGVDIPTECELSDLIHQDILERAVRLALTSRLNQTNKSN